MKRKIISLVLCLLVFSTMVLTVCAKNNPVQDYAGLLNTTEKEVLAEWCLKFQDAHDLDVVLLAIPNLMGKSPQAFADDFYENNRYGENGVLFLLDMGSRQWHISTAGTAIELLSDRDLADIEASVIPYFSEGRYYDGFCRFLDILPDYLTVVDASGGINLFLSLIIGAAIAGIIILVMRSAMNTKKPQRSAENYETVDSYRLKTHQDLFLYSNISKRPRPQNHSSGSSIHRSSSGRSHGGRGGRF